MSRPPAVAARSGCRASFACSVGLLALCFASLCAAGDFPNPRATIEPESRLRERPSLWRFGMGLGYKRLESAWTPAEHQLQFVVVDGAYRQPSWPLAVTLGMGLSVSTAVPRYAGVTADFCGTYEVSAGVRGEWPEHAGARVFAGAGVAIVGASTTNREVIVGYTPPGFTPAYDQEHDAGLGTRVETGFSRPVGRRMRLGLRGAWSRGRVQLFGRHLDPGGLQLDALVFWGR